MSDSSIREILSLQIGHYANCVGTHWWNLQESSFIYDPTKSTDLNHDYYFQTGLTFKGEETFTPRLVIVDSLGSLGALKCQGSLYDEDIQENHESLHWDEKSLQVQQLSHPKNDFLKDLENEEKQLLEAQTSSSTNSVYLQKPKEKKVYDLRHEVKYWSDYLKPHLHPSTICLLPSVWHWQVAGCSDPNVKSLTRTQDENMQENGKPLKKENLWSFENGRDAASAESFHEEIIDSIRKSAEKCNSLQGVTLLGHGHDGMGGVTSVILEHLKDDYNSKIVISFPITPPSVDLYSNSVQSSISTNTLMTYSHLFELSDLVVPLNLRQHPYQIDATITEWPFYKYETSNAYESSSIFSLFLETISSSFKNKKKCAGLSDATYILSQGGRKLVTGALSFPAAASLKADSGPSLSGNPLLSEDERKDMERKTQEIPSNSFISRRGHICSASDLSQSLYQVKDQVTLQSPFPLQCLANLPQVNGAYLEGISCEARLIQGIESAAIVKTFAEEFLNPIRVRARKKFCSQFPYEEDMCQQWMEAAQIYYGEDKFSISDDDSY